MDNVIHLKIVDQLREITAEAVAKKQDAARLNFPKIIERAKAAAARGDSHVLIPVSEMNEHDARILAAENINAVLIDRPIERYDRSDSLRQYIPQDDKVWKVSW